jgi:hypothetical protein
MRMFGRLFRLLFGRRPRQSAQEDAGVERHFYSTGRPGEVIMHTGPGTRILTSPREFAFRGRIDAAGMQ